MFINTSIITYILSILHSSPTTCIDALEINKNGLNYLLKMTENVTFISFFITSRILKKDKYKDQTFKTDLYFGE